jgi:hypothetical protein
MDFVAALHLLATQLGLAFEESQLASLFDAVSAGAPWVVFDDFVNADSTRHYLRMLALEYDGWAGGDEDGGLLEA